MRNRIGAEYDNPARRQPSSRKTQAILSQTELAGMIHATRENVSRCLGHRQRQGNLVLDERWIIILRHDVLDAIAGYS
jgi:hypothetical protein